MVKVASVEWKVVVDPVKAAELERLKKEISKLPPKRG